MLHFNGYVKVKMARSILRYFKGLYLLEPSLGENKQEGVARLEALKTLPDHKRRVEDPKFDRGIFLGQSLRSMQNSGRTPGAEIVCGFFFGFFG